MGSQSNPKKAHGIKCVVSITLKTAYWPIQNGSKGEHQEVFVYIILTIENNKNGYITSLTHSTVLWWEQKFATYLLND